MAKTAAETKGAIDDEQVIDETMAVTGKTIEKKAWYDWTSDKQANTAMDSLTSLPKDLQGKAVEKLPEDQFKNLVSEVPADKAETAAASDLRSHVGAANPQQTTILNDFSIRAAERGTPDQLEQLRKDYEARLDAAKTP